MISPSPASLGTPWYCALGVCRVGVQAGDKLVLIPGVPLPLITRPTDEAMNPYSDRHTGVTERLISPARLCGVKVRHLSERPNELPDMIVLS